MNYPQITKKWKKLIKIDRKISLKKTQQIIEKESKTKEMETDYLRYKNEVSVKDQEIQAMKENIAMDNQDLKCQLFKYTDLMKERDQLCRALQQQKSDNDIITKLRKAY